MRRRVKRGFDLYKWFWSHTVGRPYTYIIRDFAYRNPLLLILAAVFIILWLLHIKHEMFFIMIGILLGHLFWGTHWRKGQKE